MSGFLFDFHRHHHLICHCFWSIWCAI